MKQVIVLPSRGFLLAYRLIVVLVLALVVALAAGSLYALIRPADARPLFRIGGEKPAAKTAHPDTVNIFSGIGRLRIPVPGNSACTVILSVSFPYSADDRAFAEELASRVGDFRTITSQYFSALSPEQITRLNEEAAKAEILNRYNAALRLGKIETLYFGDLMIIE
ncbi:MAG: flagellar basal body protein FliL [Treponema sp.]|jgi:flagellar basal body-associated protein FliL|nr:flagellar basal body protein FliL [Treponema sp.]